MKQPTQSFILITLLFIVSSCSQSASKMQSDVKSIDTTVIALPKSYGNIAPRHRMGERISLSGDFDGDGKADTVYESYISALTGAETYKDMDSTDWEGNIAGIIKNKPVSRLYTDIKGVDTFVVSREHQLRGLMVLDNLGNIYGDKGDELGYVIDWADYSNLNHYHIITLLNGKWKELYSFEINESVNYQPENLFDSTSIIKSVEHGRIRYKYFDNQAEVSDTIVTLK